MGKAPSAPTPLRLQPGRNCCAVAKAKRAALIVDAADYYRYARAAMLEARERIMLIGWDVDTRVHLDEEPGPSGAPVALGPLLSWLSKRKPELEIYVLAWDEGLISIPGRGTTILRMLRWWADRRVTIKWDSTHPLDASHHQKILVIDDALAFCGGIDITASRWDTRHHRDKEPGRKRPFTGRAYEPWHDAIMAVDGDAAKALGELGRERWKAATDDELLVPSAKSDPWPEALKPLFHDVDVAMARTRGHEEAQSELREIEALFVDMIAAAKSYVYVETQYFASRVIAEAIARRLEEKDGPEFIIVNPRTAEGWLDEEVMSPARYALVKELRKRDKYGRFRIYTPVTEGGLDIYVHAKVTIVDDRYLRVGSANMNNRSMGLDSECDLMIDGSRNKEALSTIAALRADLLAEHLGKTLEKVQACFEKTGSLIGCIEEMRGRGRTLLPFKPEKPNLVEKAVSRSELLDPEAPNEIFEPRTARPGLLSRLHH
ncbi:MAG TPA: phospholipase D-like domain-containing protein [Allosphingosinicella sp.]|uniref:phospholipase D-like domain-containing protein n=1 Tax=Allosphingosinicella sp. TaxID=2823234 RepID=UPI002EDB7FC6